MKHLHARYELIFNESQVQILDKIVEYACKMHENQCRDSGEPYITHPIAVANILLDLGLDYCTIGASILHDVVEDTVATENELRKLFGDEITELVLGVTKLAKITFKSKEEEQAENFRRMFFAMAKDIRVILIKLADRLHNMRTISSISEDRQLAMAKETLDIYAPLASRLGLSYLKCELEDLCLKVMHPAVYDSLVNEISLKRAERKELVTQICTRLNDMLKDLKINGEVSGRPKHFYSIYKKMVNHNRTFEQIYDLTAVRVIVESIRDCYEVLGLIHTMWKPIPGRFKDYIAVPKPNNYQSLHTTVMTSFGMPFEIQIRTYEMHKIAEYGIAAHWKYKENRSGNNDFDEKLEWLRGVMDVQGDVSSPQEFYESLKIDLYDGQVFIFTPKGDVVILPEGSTPIDFAYSVHSEVGNKCVGAKINNKIVPLETTLATGDYVDIITSVNAKGPSRDWLRFVKTTQAKTKIRTFFKKELKEDNIKRGKEMLEFEAKHRGYNLSSLMVSKWLDVIMQRYSISSLDDLYASIGYGGFTVNQILLKLIDFYKREVEAKSKIETKQDATFDNKNGQGIIIKGHSDLLVRLARCCNPVPGDEIIGFISRGRGVAVHRTNCPNLKNIESFRKIEAKWAIETTAPFVVSMQVEAKNSSGLLAKITAIISELKLSINSFNARLDKNDYAIISLGVKVNKIEQIDTLMKKIQQISEVDNIFRSNPQ